MQTGHTKRRRYARLKVDQPVFIEVLQENGTSNGGANGFSRTKSLGEGGCSFRSPEDIGYLSLMKVAISLGSHVVVADGRAVYQLAQRDGGYEIGVEFLRVSSDDRLHIRQMVASSANGVTRKATPR